MSTIFINIVFALTNRRQSIKIKKQSGKEMRVNNHKKRVVITGIGPVTPIGVGKEAYWESLTKGKTCFRQISFPDKDMSQYRCHIGAPIDGFDLSHFVERSNPSMGAPI